VRYLSVTASGSGYRADLAEAPAPVPASGEALIRVTASGVNRADLSQIAGRYPPPPGEPEILGLEVSGTLDGSGRRVCALLAGGGHAELVAAPVGQIFDAPRAPEPIASAGIPEAFLTAFLNLVVEGELKRGDAALVHAGASGVGLAAIQLARFLGARVAATTRTASKLAAIRQAGADLAIDTRAANFAAALEEAWGRDSIAVVLDPIGADTLPGDLRVLRPDGHIAFIATLSGSNASLDLGGLIRKRARLIGSTLRSRSREDKARLVERFRREVLPGFDRGALGVVVDAVYPPQRAGEAFEKMKENRNVGKILIDWTR
jgi:putative PIG3 family NAD(P)H quinone oxidoreductase